MMTSFQVPTVIDMTDWRRLVFETVVLVLMLRSMMNDGRCLMDDTWCLMDDDDDGEYEASVRSISMLSMQDTMQLVKEYERIQDCWCGRWESLMRKMKRFVWVEKSFIEDCLMAVVLKERGILLLTLLIYPRLRRELYLPPDIVGKASWSADAVASTNDCTVHLLDLITQLHKTLNTPFYHLRECVRSRNEFALDTLVTSRGLPSHNPRVQHSMVHKKDGCFVNSTHSVCVCYIFTILSRHLVNYWEKNVMNRNHAYIVQFFIWFKMYGSNRKGL